MRALLLVNVMALVSLADVPSPGRIRAIPDPAPAGAQCTRDDQCVVTDERECCSSACCGPEARVMSVQERNEQQRRCATKDCALPDCSAVKCRQPEPASHFFAVCRNYQCVKVRKPEDAQTCTRDDECLMSTYSCCGNGCCGGTVEPYSTTRAGLKEAQLRCQHTECLQLDCMSDQNCPAVHSIDSFRAVCRNSRCLREERAPSPPPQNQCHQDSECTVWYPPGRCTSACGCCPSPNAVARHSGLVVDERRSPRAADKSGEPRFGLSQGGSAPACPPCPQPIPATAICQQGQCRIAPDRVRLQK